MRSSCLTLLLSLCKRSLCRRSRALREARREGLFLWLARLKRIPGLVRILIFHGIGLFFGLGSFFFFFVRFFFDLCLKLSFCVFGYI